MPSLDLYSLIDKFLASDFSIFDNQGQPVEMAEIRDRIHSLSNYIIRMAPAKRARVAIRMSHNYPYLLTILACMRCGATFIPLSPLWPESRLAQIRNISGFDIEITDDLFQQLSAKKNETLKTQENTISSASEVLYIMFTSGSTGEPKGVEISVSAYEHFLSWTNDYFSDITETSHFLCTTQYTFDVSLAEVAILLTRRTKFFFSSFNNNYFRLAQEIQNYKISAIATVPYNLNIVLSEAVYPRYNLSSLCHLLFAGSRFPYSLYEKLLKLPEIQSYNIYGPTECTIYAFSKKLSLNPDMDLKNTNISIGSAITDVIGILVDERTSQITEPFTQGELLLAGPQVMNGYAGREDLTSQAIIEIDGRRFYRTGDLCFFDEKSEFYVIGRTNETLKRRGFRVDLVDIDSYLMKLACVNDALTVAYPHPDHENILVSFLILNRAEEMQVIMNEARKILVSYQLPDHLEIVESFPLNNSGKADRRALFELFRTKYLKTN